MVLPLSQRFSVRDVSPVVAERQIVRYRAMSPSEKLALADGLWDLAWNATVAGVRMRSPDLDTAGIEAQARQILRNAAD